MQVWLPSAIKGLFFGLVVSVINHAILWQGMKKAQHLSLKEKKSVLLKRYGMRYFMNIVALLTAYLVLKADEPFLVATAFGLMASKNMYILRYFRTRKA